MEVRVGHELLVGKTTLKKLTVIDIQEHYNNELYYVIVDEEGNVKNIDLDGLDDFFALLKNGITKPETKDEVDKITVEGEEEGHINKLNIGTKVKFTTQYRNASLEVVGYIVRNYWSNYYLVSELGTSIANRYWKVAHSETKLA